MTERETAEVGLLSWICGVLDHRIGGHWVRRGVDGVYVCLCGTAETNRAPEFYGRLPR